MKLRHVHHWTFDKLICAISIICLAVVLVLVLVLRDSLRTYFKSLSLSWSLGVRSLLTSLVRACFKENSWLHNVHILIAKAGLQFLNDLFCQKISIYPAKFPNDLFCHCTNSLSSLHISIHHCTFCASLHVKTSPELAGSHKLHHVCDCCKTSMPSSLL